MQGSMQPWINFGKYLRATVIIYAQSDICVRQLFHHASPTCKKKFERRFSQAANFQIQLI